VIILSYEDHKDGMCDRCEEKQATKKLPFIYKDMNDRAHTDLGDGYRQYFVCDDCYEIQMAFKNARQERIN
jgi:hypothetical protein